MKSRSRRQVLHLAAGAAALPAVSGIARAQAYPTQPIKIVVPYPAGGSGDIAARNISDRMGPRLGQPMTIENVGGGGSTIGTARVARAPADGYTLLLHQTGMATTATAYAKLPYNTEKDFIGVGLVNHSPLIFLAKNGLPVN